MTAPYYPPPPKPKRKKWPWIVGGVVFVGVVSSCISNSNSSGPTEVSNPVAVAPAEQSQPAIAGPSQLGATIDIDGLQITASSFEFEEEFGTDFVCSRVDYVNNDLTERGYSSFDWNLQDPNNVITSTSIMGSNQTLSTGQLAPSGQVSGDVCFRDPALVGTYLLSNEEMFSFSDNKATWTTEVTQ